MFHTDEKNMNKQQNEVIDKPMYCLGFVFSIPEIRMMNKAQMLAVKFMKKYGKGAHPCSIDLSHYENSNKNANQNIH